MDRGEADSEAGETDQATQPSTEPSPRSNAALTPREDEVLVLVATGKTNAEIAADLNVSFSTAKAHVASILHKLEVRNRVEIAAWAYQMGRVTP